MQDVEADCSDSQLHDEIEPAELQRCVAHGAGVDGQDRRPLLAAIPPTASRASSTVLVLGPVLLLAAAGAALWARPGRSGGGGFPRSRWASRDGGLAHGLARLYPVPGEQTIPRYEQALDCYCGRDVKIGSTHRGVGKQRCQELCAEEPKCVAFEMYKGGEDCTLRPHCPDPRKSAIGTFLVLFAHRNNGSLFPSQLAMMCSGSHYETPSPVRVPEPTTAAPSSTTIATTTSVPPGSGRRYFADWGKVLGGAQPPASTIPLYRTQDPLPMDAVHIAPPFGGTRVKVANTCREVFKMLWNEGCEVDPLLWQFKRTCHGSTVREWKTACKRWFGAGQIGSVVADVTLAEECLNDTQRLEDEEWLGNYTAPASAEEGHLCFDCTSVTCVVRANYSGPRLVFEYGEWPPPSPTVPPTPVGHWAPDGSPNHCRPTVDGQVSGLQKRVRREVHLWTDEEFLKFGTTLQSMRFQGKYASFANNFTRRIAPGLPQLTRLQSLPWRRRFLLDFETELQRVAGDCDLTLPFWISSLEASPTAFQDSVVWSPVRLGGKPSCSRGSPPCHETLIFSGRANCSGKRSAYCLHDGVASGWLVQGPTKGDCACVHRAPTLEARLAGPPTLFRMMGNASDLMSISSKLGALAAYMHCGVVGADSTLCSPTLAPWDPLFFLLQADLDRLFLNWQRYRFYRHNEDTTDCTGCAQLMTLYGEPISEMLGLFETESRGAYIELPKSSPRVAVTYQEGYDPVAWL